MRWSGSGHLGARRFVVAAGALCGWILRSVRCALHSRRVGDSWPHHDASVLRVPKIPDGVHTISIGEFLTPQCPATVGAVGGGAKKSAGAGCCAGGCDECGAGSDESGELRCSESLAPTSAASSAGAAAGAGAGTAVLRAACRGLVGRYYAREGLLVPAAALSNARLVVGGAARVRAGCLTLPSPRAGCSRYRFMMAARPARRCARPRAAARARRSALRGSWILI